MRDDLIRRSDAIDAVTAYLDLCCMTEARFHREGKSYNRQIADEIFDNVLAVEPKQGKWIMSDIQRAEDTENGNYLYICSVCGHGDIHARTQEVPYCWWCGSLMKGADGEHDK